MGRRRGGRRRLREQAQTAARAGTPTPAGTAGSVQFSENNALAGSANLTFSTSQGLELTGTLHTEGNLGINMSGTAPTHGITLPDTSKTDGQVKANSFVTYSSIRFKKDVQKLENAMDVINKLEGVSYKWKDTDKQDYGFIAEDVNRILPEIVEWDEESDHATSMDYMRIISFLVEAVKYQHNKLNELAERVDNGSE